MVAGKGRCEEEYYKQLDDVIYTSGVDTGEFTRVRMTAVFCRMASYLSLMAGPTLAGIYLLSPTENCFDKSPGIALGLAAAGVVGWAGMRSIYKRLEEKTRFMRIGLMMKVMRNDLDYISKKLSDRE